MSADEFVSIAYMLAQLIRLLICWPLLCIRVWPHPRWSCRSQRAWRIGLWTTGGSLFLYRVPSFREIHGHTSLSSVCRSRSRRPSSCGRLAWWSSFSSARGILLSGLRWGLASFLRLSALAPHHPSQLPFLSWSSEPCWAWVWLHSEVPCPLAIVSLMAYCSFTGPYLWNSA